MAVVVAVVSSSRYGSSSRLTIVAAVELVAVVVDVIVIQGRTLIKILGGQYFFINIFVTIVCNNNKNNFN